MVEDGGHAEFHDEIGSGARGRRWVLVSVKGKTLTTAWKWNVFKVNVSLLKGAQTVHQGQQQRVSDPRACVARTKLGVGAVGAGAVGVGVVRCDELRMGW